MVKSNKTTQKIFIFLDKGENNIQNSNQDTRDIQNGISSRKFDCFKKISTVNVVHRTNNFSFKYLFIC